MLTHLRMLGAGVVIVAGLAATSAMTPVPVSSVPGAKGDLSYADAMVLTPVGARLVDCGNCSQEDCAPEEHKYSEFIINGEAPDRGFDESNHGCENGWCSFAHPESSLCQSDDSDIEMLDEVAAASLWEVVQVNDRAALAQMVLDAGSGILVNQNRSALQVLACNGGVRVSIPLNSTQLEELTAAVK